MKVKSYITFKKYYLKKKKRKKEKILSIKFF